MGWAPGEASCAPTSGRTARDSYQGLFSGIGAGQRVDLCGFRTAVRAREDAGDWQLTPVPKPTHPEAHIAQGVLLHWFPKPAMWVVGAGSNSAEPGVVGVTLPVGPS